MDRTIALLLWVAAMAMAAPVDRVTNPVDPQRVHALPGNVHPLAKPQFDQGAVDPTTRLEDMMLLVRPSASQQADLNQLLADLQNPSSAHFHQWLTPEAFGDRFGLSLSDHSKVVAWLSSQGLEVQESGRARNWIRFSGSAGQVGNALHTPIHRYEMNGEKHFANAAPVSVPEALAGVVGGFTGLNDFYPKPRAKTVTPDFTNGANHFLVPEDFYTIYDVNPIAAAGIDGTGVNIGIIGGSQLALSDIRTFRSRYNLPAKDPQTVVVGKDPGTVASALTEADLDVEWSGAIAPGASVYYYYGNNVSNAIVAAINANVVHIISISFGSPELDNPTLEFQPIMQQANAQGITLFSGCGDDGAASAVDPGPFSALGPAVKWPASYPEVTATGGTQFDDTTNPSQYWAPTNDANSGSALSYIPEIAWSSTGGGASVIFPKPAWQVGPGVPQDGARDMPDIALNASGHDGYEIVSGGSTLTVGGDSCTGPTMAGITALLTEYLLANGQISSAGLGNINPQIYRMAQAFPNAFHDITSGSNAVTCRDGSPGCAIGSFGYSAGPGYDQVTGNGSLDVNNFITQWNNTTNPVAVTFTASPSNGTFNDTIQLSAIVTPVSGSGTPTGTVDFSSNGTLPLGSAALDSTSGQAVANLNVPGYLFLNAGTYSLTAQYRGDTVFGSGGAASQVQIAAPSGVASIVPVVPVSVTATPDPAGLYWQFAITLNERGGVAAVLTDINLDGQDQPVSQFFQSATIPANGSITSSNVVFRNLAYPLVRTFIFSGMDATGQAWSTQVSITFVGLYANMQAPALSATPLVIPQDPTAATNCQWSQQVVVTEFSGYAQTIGSVKLGNTSIADPIAAIFGTAQLAPYGSLAGSICWSGAAAGETDMLSVNFAPGLSQTLAVSFGGPLANPSPVSVSPSSVALSTANNQATFSVTVPDGQSWTIGVSPQNITSGWLSLSQNSGTGAAQIAVTASGSGFAPGAYLASLVIQGPNLSPPSVTVPITFVNGDSTGVTISNLTNAASGQSVAAPGMLAVLEGSGLYRGGLTVSSAFGPVYNYAPNAGTPISITVNGIPAALTSASPTQIKFQIPYEVGAGAAVVGVSYAGKVGAYAFQVAPSAPGIFADSTGSVGTVQAGKQISLTMTGDGVTNPAMADATAGAASLLHKTALPIALTIGGVAASITSYGIAANSYSTTLNVAVPASAPVGVQPVVVTVGGVSSPPVNLTVTAAPSVR